MPADPAARACLPSPVTALLDSPPSHSAWVSEALAWAAVFAIGDLKKLDPEQWEDWRRRDNRSAFSNPVLRQIVRLASPALVLSLGSAYWGTVRRGTRLTFSKQEQRAARASLSFPVDLINARGLRDVAISFEVVLEMSGARRARVDVEKSAPGSATFRARWD